MRVGRVLAAGEPRVGVVAGDEVKLAPAGLELAAVLFDDDPSACAAALAAASREALPLAAAPWLAPIDRQEVWAAGVTYLRSKKARMDESASAAVFYDKVYEADRPELFFKAPPRRVVGHGAAIRARADSKWTVLEPELVLVLTPDLRCVGYTAGNDMSARDIEGDNPLYLPQAKTYDACCALGPTVVLCPALPAAAELTIELAIERDGAEVFRGATSIAQMRRRPLDLVAWLGRDSTFPDGAFLFTGTGIVPPDDFTVRAGDLIHIDIAGVGRLTNPVELRA